MEYNNVCLSSFLTFRYVVDKKAEWKKGLMPEFPEIKQENQYKVKTSEEVYKKLKELTPTDNKTGIFLSGGIDSAILASFLPEKAKAYTIKFVAPGAVDETIPAKKYADKFNLDLKIVEIHWQDFKDFSELLMKNKKAPLHPIEIALYKAAKIAKDDEINNIIVGNGADSTFGGMDKLLSKDWTFDEFVERYSFLKPKKVLKEPVSMIDTYLPYKSDKGFNVQTFLKTIHGIGIIQTFENAIKSAGCKISAPYEDLKLDVELDIQRIRKGEPKYILQKIFAEIYPEISIPDKIPFARPMDIWLKDWKGTKRKEFIENLDISQFTGDQKWLIYNLEQFLNLFDK